MKIKLLICEQILFINMLTNLFGKNEIKEQYKIILNEEDLKESFPNIVLEEEIKENISNNSKISKEYQEYTKEFIELVIQKYPEFDLNVFNENIKKLEVIEQTKKEIQKERKREAYYSIIENKIYIHNEFKEEKQKKFCYFHELWHVFNNMKLKDKNVVYYKSTTIGNINAIALDEGMTTFLTNQILETNILSYTKQYDEIQFLYQIFGEELITKYINEGISGIEYLISKYLNYDEIINFINLTNEELKENKDSIEIYKILIKIYINSNSITPKNNLKILEIIENTCYNIKTKKEILQIYKDYICNMEINQSTQITFDNKKYYLLDELYYVTINNIKYLVNNEILISYFDSGYIKNVFDEEKIYIGKENIKISSFKEFVIYNSFLTQIDNVIYIDKNEIDVGEQYVKNK